VVLGTLGTKTLGGFSEIGFGGETIHPSWSSWRRYHTDFFNVLQCGEVYVVWQLISVSRSRFLA
jgi:hypothetical protein